MKVTLLLGAGASIPAGIPSIDGLTKEFKSQLYSNYKKFAILSRIAEEQFGKSDLETIMSLIVKLENKTYKETLTHQYEDLKKIGAANISQFKIDIQSHIRKKCEKITNVDYLWAIEGLLDDKKPLDVFSLNYDGVLEIYCKKNNITYEDGFSPFWNFENFLKKENQINHYKLHGSLYWFKGGEGNFIKVPIMGLQPANIRYLTDKSVSELMIYPELEKNKHQIVYSSLFQKFREDLSKTKVCVIIGYSFRDTDIRESIIEAISSNHDLWLIIVNPEADNIKKNLGVDKELSSKIVVMNMGIEEALGNRKLHSYLEKLEDARRKEKIANSLQSKNENRLDKEWLESLEPYLAIEHHDRIKWLMERLLKNRFKEERGSYPFTIEALLGPYSIRYVISSQQDRKRNLEFWKKFFLQSCVNLEFVFFAYNEKLRETNPVKISEVPSVVNNYTTMADHIVLKLKIEAEKILPEIKNVKLKTTISKLIETCDFLTMKKDISKDGSSYRKNTPEEIIEAYKKNNLGIKKWAKKIVAIIK